MKKIDFVGIIAVILTSCLVLMGCSDMMSGPGSGSMGPGSSGSANLIPSDHRNTTWTRQVNGSETVTISFGRDTMTMSSNGVSSQYNQQQWDYRGAYCCGYGYCAFYNGPNFQYTSNNSSLDISRSTMQSLNGSWTRK